jgi:TPR repeat protein
MNNLGISYLNGPDRDLQKADEWMLRAAQPGHPNAQRYMRSKGYAGAFPPAINVDLAMKPEPKKAVGHTKECGLYIS